MDEVWHRFENWLTAPPVDEFDHVCGESQLHFAHRTFRVIKRTPKGVWLDMGFCGKRFVLSSARNMYACPDIQAALESFRARKLKEAKIHQKQADRALKALHIAEGIYLRVNSENGA